MKHFGKIAASRIPLESRFHSFIIGKVLAMETLRDIRSGDVIRITNGRSIAMRYTVEFGRLGSICVTLPPGGAIEVTAGVHIPAAGPINIILNDEGEPGLSVVNTTD